LAILDAIKQPAHQRRISFGNLFIFWKIVKREILAVDQTGTDHQIEEEEIKTGKTKKSLDSTERK
jgi:hypothetical protein